MEVEDMSDKPIRKISAQEIEAARSPKGGWTKATLAAWGVAWPPRAGWKERLIAGEPAPQPGVDGVVATSSRPSACLEAKLLQQVVMAVINAGQSDILKGIDELNVYYGGGPLPTVADVIGGRPEHAIITGDISFDDTVYSFKCARTIKKPKT
jgi:hypothetical protein